MTRRVSSSWSRWEKAVGEAMGWGARRFWRGVRAKCDLVRHALWSLVREEAGQSTLEYLLVALALSAIVIGLGALVTSASDGTMGELATRAASHSVQTETPGGALLDVLMF